MNNTISMNMTPLWRFLLISSVCMFPLLCSCTSKEEETPVVKVQSIGIEQSDMMLTEGESVNLSAKVFPENAEDKTITWSSSNENVVMVSSIGKAMALSIGKAVVTAKSGDKSDFITITVEAKVIPVTGVSLDKTQITTKVGDTEMLTPTITPDEATNKKVSWTSSNDKVATVEDGKVVGVQPGSVTITVTTEDGAKTAECPVIVKSNLAPSVTIDASHISAVSAVLSGKANLESTIASDLKVGFQLSKSPGILPSNSTAVEATEADASYNYTASITDLEPATKYYFRSFVRQNGQDTYGETKEFMTSEISTLLQTRDASKISAVSAVLNASIDMTDVQCAEIHHGFYWGESEVAMTNKVIVEDVTGSFSAGISVLEPSKDYCFQAFVVVDGKEHREKVLTFTTKGLETLLSTLDASGVEAAKAKLNARLDLTDVGYKTLEYGFYYGTSEYSETNFVNGSEIEDATYSVFMTGLSHKTQYLYKACVTLDSKTFYGEVKTFTTGVVSVESISLDKTEYTFNTIGSAMTLEATILPSDATDKSLEWSSDNINVATVDKYGCVKAIGEGYAVITGKTIDQEKTATCLVTVIQNEENKPVLKLEQNIVSYVGEEINLDVTSGTEWTLCVEYNTDEHEWISLEKTSGGATRNERIKLLIKPNYSDNIRRASIVLKGPIFSATEYISQNGLLVDNAPVWLELPALDRAGFIFGTHDMAGGLYQGQSKSGVRNYSFYWDPEGKVSFWVAYPLNKDLCGGGNYNYDWTQAYDPLVPKDQQPNLTEHSYGGRGWDGVPWYRGHQMPRADRQLTQASVMSTCRTTNITPQCSSFNGGIWGDLEGWVRGRAKELDPKKDTMYVVTGCVQEGSTTWTDNTYQAAVKVPAAYFKACLRKSGSTYTALAFYLPQTKEAYDKGVFTGNFKDYSLSVSDLEKKLNTTFFVNLENLPGMDKAKATAVKNTKASW